MKRSLFDKIFLGFLFMTIGVFALLIVYATLTTRQSLISEKSEVLTNEAFLISEQTISGYFQGKNTIEDTQKSLNYYSQTLDASIWLCDEKGIIIAFSKVDGHPANPKNIFFVDQDFDITKAQTLTGDFFGIFKDDVITVALPIKVNDEPAGMILLHSTVTQLHNIQGNLIKTIYIPFLLMLIVSFILLALISNKVMKPIKKINSVAEEYSLGNFDYAMDIHSHDEIGQLAATLEYMASELSKLEDYRRDFISNVSHDFRSPLTSIKGYIEAILDGTIPPEKHEKYLNIVLTETKRLTKLTQGMLELNSMDNLAPWLSLKNFDIIELVKGAVNTFEGKCEEKNIYLELNNHCTSTLVYADKTKIQQVIYNLLDNAIKFTPKDKSIYITLTEKNDKIFISVKDEGIGISKDDQKKIWVRFYKGDPSRGKDKQGTGLGLAITKEIIKAHNENINVISTEGVGSEFTFSLSKAASNDAEKA